MYVATLLTSPAQPSLDSALVRSLRNAWGGGEATWFEFASEIIKQAGVEATMTPCASSEFATRALRPGYSVLDTSKLASAYAPMPPWRESLARYLKAKGHI